MLQPTRIVEPITEMLTRAEVKMHLRVDSTDEDSLIDSLIEAVISYFDGYSGILGRALFAQTWRQQFRCFERKMKLPVPPVQSVVSISYSDTLGATQQIASTEWQLLTAACGSWVEPKFNKVWPVPAPGSLITIDYITGGATIPRAIKQAALLLIGHWFENRQAMGSGSELPMAVSALIAPFRKGII